MLRAATDGKIQRVAKVVGEFVGRMIGKPEQGQHLLDKQRVEKGRLAFHTDRTNSRLLAGEKDFSELLVGSSQHRNGC